MLDEYTTALLDRPDWDTVGKGISAYNARMASDDRPRSLCFVVKAPGGEVVAGIIGSTYWDWFHLELLWVTEDLRGQGFGSHLLELAESEAHRRGARGVHLDTFSFQAPDFYRKHGYRVFGELLDCPAGHTRYYMTKALEGK